MVSIHFTQSLRGSGVLLFPWFDTIFLHDENTAIVQQLHLLDSLTELAATGPIAETWYGNTRVYHVIMTGIIKLILQTHILNSMIYGTVLISTSCVIIYT